MQLDEFGIEAVYIVLYRLAEYGLCTLQRLNPSTTIETDATIDIVQSVKPTTVRPLLRAVL